MNNTLKLNTKNKYFLLQVLNLANCYKDIDPEHSIFLKTDRLIYPLSDFEIKRRAKILCSIGALTLENVGGKDMTDDKGKHYISANTYKFHWDTLHSLYEEFRDVPLADLYKLSLTNKIKHGVYIEKDQTTLEKTTISSNGKVVAKKVRRLSANEAWVSSKYRKTRFIDTVQEAIDKVHERYRFIFAKLLEDINICNITLDDRRKMHMTDKITYDNDGLLRKIGERCVNSLVNAKAHNVEHDEYGNIVKDEKSKRYKEEVLKHYDLHEYDNSDVSTSIPRLTYVYNKKGKWNDIADFYVTIYNKALELAGISYTFVRDKSKSDREELRDSIKALLLPCYFDKTASTASWHIWSKVNKNSRHYDPDWRGTHAMKFSQYLTDRTVELKESDIRHIVECFYDAMRDIIGPTMDSEVFLLESAAYTSVAAIIAERGIQFWQVYDALYTSEYVPDLSSLYEQEVEAACFRLRESKKRKINREIESKIDMKVEEDIKESKRILEEIRREDEDDAEDASIDNTLVITFSTYDNDLHSSQSHSSSSQSQSQDITLQQIAVSDANKQRAKEDGYATVSDAQKKRAAKEDGYATVSDANKKRFFSDEKLGDILNLTREEFMTKWKCSRRTYYNWLKKIQ